MVVAGAVMEARLVLVLVHVHVLVVLARAPAVEDDSFF